MDPDTGKRVTDWIEKAWEQIVRMDLGLPPLEDPEWLTQLATTRLAISTPQMLGWFERWNARDPKNRRGVQKPYPHRVKPFGFLQHAPLPPSLREATAGSNKNCNLVAPHGERKWWVNLHEPNGKRVRVVPYQPSAGNTAVLVGCGYDDLIAAHPYHPEAKSLGPDGLPCRQRTIGLLDRRPVIGTEIIVIGKEANDLEQVETGLIDDLEVEVQMVYKRDRSEARRERLRGMSVKEAMEFTGLSRRQVFYLRSRQRRSSTEH
jgi:hypothetical protein